MNQNIIIENLRGISNLLKVKAKKRGISLRVQEPGGHAESAEKIKLPTPVHNSVFMIGASYSRAKLPESRYEGGRRKYKGRELNKKCLSLTRLTKIIKSVFQKHPEAYARLKDGVELTEAVNMKCRKMSFNLAHRTRKMRSSSRRIRHHITSTLKANIYTNSLKKLLKVFLNNWCMRINIYEQCYNSKISDANGFQRQTLLFRFFNIKKMAASAQCIMGNTGSLSLATAYQN